MVRTCEGGLAVAWAGEGNPTVVFEAGLGGTAASWAAVQRVLSGTVRTLAYDRAGLGGSAPSQQERTLPQLADELNGLLDALRIDHPVVLVAHSWGAAIVRCFAASHPERVAGLVLVDGTISAVTPPRLARINRRTAGVVARLARLGLHRPLVRASLRSSKTELSAQEQSALLSDLLSPAHLRGAAAEAAGVEGSLDLLRELEAQGLPDVPVTTVIGGVTGRGAGGTLRRTLQERARQEMNAHPQGRLVVAHSSGHAVPLTEPQYVAEAVLDVLRQLPASHHVRTAP